MQTIDARGLSCPQPLILTTRAMQQSDAPFDVLIDDAVARENILRMLAERYGLHPAVESSGAEMRILVRR